MYVLGVAGFRQVSEGAPKVIDTRSVEISHSNTRAGPSEWPRRDRWGWDVINLRTLRGLRQRVDTLVHLGDSLEVRHKGVWTGLDWTIIGEQSWKLGGEYQVREGLKSNRWQISSLHRACRIQVRRTVALYQKVW